MEIGKYKYNLANSSIIQIDKKGTAVNLNLNLTPNLNNINVGAIISGRVIDLNNNAIKNATVKLMNENLEPLYHVVTDENGEYMIENVPYSDSYKILAIGENKLIDIPISFSLSSKENKIINFILSEDPNVLKGILSGRVIYEDTPISGAVVSIYSILNSITTLIGITFTDYLGVFFLSNLNAGNYEVKISALGYVPYKGTVTITSGKIFSLNTSLNLNENSPLGIISGIITDDLNNFIANADVTLYSVDKFNNLTPLSFTESNSSGIYLFSNVPVGNYIVKSNQSELMDITKKSSETIIHTSGFLASGTYDIALGTLENGAEINLFNRFAYLIGGEKNGSSTLNFNVNESGMYNIIFQYLCSDKNRQVAININGEKIGVYTSHITPSLDITDAKTMCITSWLNKGNNTIKFYGNGIDYSPNLGIVTFKPSSNFKTTYLKNPLEIFNSNKDLINISKEVQLDENIKLLKNLGGVIDNYIDFSFTAPFNGEYNLIFEYSCDENNNNLSISVNGKKTNYSLPLTNSQNLINVNTFTLPITLNKNVNVIKFHGNGVDYAPNLGLIQINLPKITSIVCEGILLNNAKKHSNTNFITNIGGPLKGTSTVSIKVSTSGLYHLYLEYLSGDLNRNLIVTINGEKSNDSYNLPKTIDWNLSSVKIFTIPINLNAGINTIKFESSYMNYGPNLGSFYVEMQKLELSIFTNSIYNVALGVLKNGATLDTDLNVVKWIGGPLDGSSSLEISVMEPGIYKLDLSYKNGGGPLRIRINNIDTGTIYNLSENISGTFSTDIIFNKTINMLDFHGDDTEYSPELGQFTLEFISPLSNTLPEGSYNIAKGVLKNGAKIDPLNNLVTYIGGEVDGSSTITVNINEYGAYDFKVQYIATDKNRPLKININGMDSGKTHIFPVTSSWIISKIDFFTIQLILNKGINKITFHGNGIDYGPSLGIVNISKVLFPIGPLAAGNYNANEGVLENGAKLDESSNFVGWIGGPNDGSSTITINANNTKTYNVSIQYISGEDRPLKIDVNEVNTGTIYMLKSTLGWTIQDAKVFTLSLPLNSGDNTIKFHGNGEEYAPSLGIVTIEDPTGLIYNASLGILKNGAKLENVSTLVGGLGGSNDGSITIIINTLSGGEYNLEVQYLSPDSNRPLKIDINEVTLEEVYYFPQTYGVTINDTKTFTIPLNLKNGGNKIRFHGNGEDYAPSIGLLTILKNTKFQVYNAYEGELSKGAKIDETTKFVTLLGGLENESCTIDVDVLGAGEYNLIIQYMAPDNERVLKIHVNELNNNQIYNIPKTQGQDISSAATFTIPINLNSGKNTIKFHGNNFDYCPSIGEIKIIKSNKSYLEPYDLTKGILTNDARIESSLEFIEGIGGPNNGAVTIKVNALVEGTYSLNIKYKSQDAERIFLTDINNINTGTVYKVPLTSGENGSNDEKFSFLVKLREGENNIKFYGNGKDYSPNLGEFTLTLDSVEFLPIVMPTIPSMPDNNIPSIVPNTLPEGTYNFANGKLEGEGKIDENIGFVKNIGGPQDSSSTLTVYVDKEERYILNIQYLSSDIERPFTLDINNEPIRIIYLSQKTKSWSKEDALTMNLIVSLKEGNNTIKIHGDGIDYTPYFGLLKISNN
ncbi:carboxypeptidase regulatory-like domain-containing protein [Clostridium tarantellae]|nr:carboxypeptidase regulatory-like domain-containing protein [Clostridium tarantellae]